MSDLTIHTKEFLKILTKCSVGNTFDFFQLLVSQDEIKTGTANANQSLVAIMTLKNDFIDGLKPNDIFEFNFISPSASIIPQLKLFKKDDLKCKLTFSKGVCVSKIKVTEPDSKISAAWSLGVPNTSLIFSNNAKLKSFEPFTELPIDDKFIEIAETIRKASSAVNKIYFTTLKNSLRLEATDWKNDFSGNFNITLQELELENSHQHIILCFDAPMFFSVLKNLDIEKDFSCKVIYKADKKVGAIMISCKDNSEMFFLPSIIEEVDRQKVVNKLIEDENV